MKTRLAPSPDRQRKRIGETSMKPSQLTTTAAAALMLAITSQYLFASEPREANSRMEVGEVHMAPQPDQSERAPEAARRQL
jgi:hypothetical protein